MYSVSELHNTWHHGWWLIGQHLRVSKPMAMLFGQHSKLFAIPHGESCLSPAVYACNQQILAHAIPVFSLHHVFAHLHHRCHDQNAGRTADD
jgi:hypothetical protein